MLHIQEPIGKTLHEAVNYHEAFSLDHFDVYLRNLQRIDSLSPEEEVQLFERWRSYKDQEAYDTIITSHLKLVLKIAKKFRGYKFPLSDLVSEGNIGLIKAIDGFDVSRGLRFSTYASLWIRAQLHEFTMNSWSLVKVVNSAATKKLFFNFRRLREKISNQNGGYFGDSERKKIAETLSVEVRDVEHMERRMAGQDHSLNEPMGNDEGSAEWQDVLVDDDDNQEVNLIKTDEMSKRSSLLTEALSKLSERESNIFRERYLVDYPVTLETLAVKYSLSKERIRQVEAIAYQKVEKTIKSMARRHKMLH